LQSPRARQEQAPVRDAVQVLPAQVRQVLRVPALARVQVRRVLRVPALARVQVLARMTRVRAVRSG